MRVTYRPTFANFTEDYLATHYSAGIKTFRRLAGGPILVALGALLIIFANARVASGWLRVPLWLLAIILILFGLQYAFVPLFNLFLVWLRRDQVLGGEDATITLELKGSQLIITTRGEKVKLPLERIKSVQHRSAGTWILTDADQLVSLPREGLLSGDHDAFVDRLDELLTPEEPEE